MAVSFFKNITSYIFPIMIEQKTGNVSPQLEVNLVNGKYVLDTEKTNYSHGALHWVFDQTFQVYNLNEREIKNVLILRFGAGSVASLLTEKFNIKCGITGVEKDQVVIDLAYKYFGINRFKNLELICNDASEYVQECSKKFDVIVVDLYIDDQVPYCFHKEEFIKQLKIMLQPQGILFFNKVVNNEKQIVEFNLLFQNMRTILGNCEIYKLTKNNTHNSILIHDRRTSEKN